MRTVMEEIRGRVWKLGDNVDTDAIVSGQYLDAPMEEIVSHVLENHKPGLAGNVKAGDIFIAGGNFGCGSSREQAPAALKALGIRCVVAASFGRIFFRNAIAIGLPVLACGNVSGAFEEGDTALVSMDRFTVENMATGTVLPCEPLSEEMEAIIAAGGIIQYLKKLRK